MTMGKIEGKADFNGTSFKSCTGSMWVHSQSRQPHLTYNRLT